MWICRGEAGAADRDETPNTKGETKTNFVSRQGEGGPDPYGQNQKETKKVIIIFI